MGIELAIVLALVLLNGFFALSELAVMTARKNRLRQMARDSRRAAVALALAEKPDRFLSSVQVWITLLGILLGFFGGEAIAERLTPVLAALPLIGPFADKIAITLAVALILFMQVVVGELVPKRIAILHPERLAMLVAIPMQALTVVAKPIVFVLAKASDGLLWLIRIRAGNGDEVTEEEIKHLVAEGVQAGVIDRHEHDMVNRVLGFGDRTVDSLMQPRNEIIWLDAALPLEDNLAVMRDTPYSRYPVKNGSDKDVLGILQVKSLTDALATGRQIDLFQRLAPAIFVPESALAISLLSRFRDAEAPFAMVVDEFGDVVGMVTPNNLLNAVFGRLAHSREDGEVPIVKRADGSFLVDGRVPVDDLRETLALQKLPNEDDDAYHTAAGMVITHYGRIPQVGERFEFGGWRFEVVDLDGARIDKLLIERVAIDPVPSEPRAV